MEILGMRICFLLLGLDGYWICDGILMALV
jgi:hypothetical protein